MGFILITFFTASQVQRDIKAKEKARELLSRRYRSSTLSEEELLQCLYAVSDNNSYLLFNRCGGKRGGWLVEQASGRQGFRGPGCVSGRGLWLSVCFL